MYKGALAVQVTAEPPSSRIASVAII